MKKTKKLKFVKSDTLLATVDVGKTSLTGYTRCPDGSEIKPFDFSNNKKGFMVFWETLLRTQKTHGLKQIVLGFESTGSYAEPFQHFFKQKPVRLVQVNPMHTKRVKEIGDNSPNKTDRKDPRVIADIIALGHGLTVILPEGAAAELRRLTQGRERAIKRRNVLYNQLHNLIFLRFPEFLSVIKSVNTKSARYLWQHYPCPERIVALGPDALSKCLRLISRGKIGADKARALFKAAQSTVGLREGCHGIDMEIAAILEEIKSCEQFVERLESAMSEQLEQISYSQILLSMKGIGLITVAGLIGEIGGFTHFGTQKELLKLAGLDLYEISSGKHRGQRRISKRGRPLLRKLLYFASLNTVRKGGVMHSHYQRHIKKGMPRIKALIAIARKLLGIMHAMVRNQSYYMAEWQVELAEAA